MEARNDIEDTSERGETTPLLDRDHKNPFEQDGSLHGRSALRDKTGNWQAASIILGVQCLESSAYYGIATNLVTYLNNIVHQGNASIASSITTWAGTSLLTPILGAVMADSYWGRYQTIFISALVYLLGTVIVTLSAFLSFLKSPSCDGNSCPAATEAQKLVFFSGLYLVAIGSGGVKSSLLPLGGDQFDDEDPVEKVKKSYFFNWFYLSINIGAVIASTLVVWIQDNVSWAVGFGISTLFMCFAVGRFISGRALYRVQKPSGSPLNRVLQVLIASVRKRKMKVPTDSCSFYELHEANSSRKLLHTDEFRFLDKAATLSETELQNGNHHNPWILCPVTQVEELKILIRLLPIWFTSVVYSVSYAQMFTTFIEQGIAMETKVGSFSVPPASLFAFEVICVMLWVIIYDTVIRKLVASENGVSELVRMGIGHLLMILTMSLAALVEMKRLASAGVGKNISIGWQLPQYFFLGASEMFDYIAQLEFFYGQAPDSMRTICTAASFLSFSLGNYLSSFVVRLVTSMTEGGDGHGWIPDNLNDGHLDYFFWTLTGLSAANFLVYVVCARNYTHKQEQANYSPDADSNTSNT
ncbi:protein NRT1/ PTR FAMILY 8.3-like [Aristolochia californica]|uniref:protein NRT1/ PTR FAMILY 8.3-like n=1 Tax=Aristolochia californica TaxID=171875 RepID=UPI0035DB41E5